MLYAILIYEDEKNWAALSEAESHAIFGQYMAYTQEMITAGKMRGGEALQPVATATTVRKHQGAQTITDGPFAETKEQLGGFYLVDAENLDEALAWAKKVPVTNGSVEVRPIMKVG